VTRQLLAFSRRQELRTEAVDLTAVARDLGTMLRALLSPSIALTAPAADAAPVWVRGARAPLEQVVLNLALNARDAMPSGGELRVLVRAEESRYDGARAVLIVADTGTGIPAAVRERIFEPFFTTKPPGRGTGLGLSTVYGFVRQFGGSVDVASAEGRGTTITVTFPLAAAGAAPVVAGAQAVAAESAPPRRRRVLLVEDERAIRAVTTRMLERAGYTVAAVEDGRAALALIEAEGGGAFDVVLTDAAMPVMGGRELIVALRRVAPALPVVLMSGYAELTGNEPSAGVAFVEKPFTNAGLLEAVAAAMSRR
jgi:CheY-like chemotaxis protein